MKMKHKNKASIFFGQVKAFCAGAVLMLLTISLANNVQTTEYFSNQEIAQIESLPMDGGQAPTDPLRLSMNKVFQIYGGDKK